jgi:ribosomal protein L29
MKTDYKHHTEKQLKEKIEELSFHIMQSYSMAEKAKAKPENRSKMRREIARIKTELKRREDEKDD